MTPMAPTMRLAALRAGATTIETPVVAEQAAFGADEDAHAVAALGEFEQAEHGFLGFEAFEQDLDGAEAFDLGDVLEQLALAADDQAGAAAVAGPGGQAGFDDGAGQGVELGAVGGHLLGDDALEFGERAAGEAALR